MPKLSDYFKGAEGAHDLASGTYRWVHPEWGYLYQKVDEDGFALVTVEWFSQIIEHEGWEFAGKV